MCVSYKLFSFCVVYVFMLSQVTIITRKSILLIERCAGRSCWEYVSMSSSYRMQVEEREEGGAINGLTISVLTHQLVKKLAQLIFSSHGRVWVTFPQLQPSKARSNSDPRIALFPALTLLRMRTCLHAHYLEKEGNSIRGETTQIQFIILCMSNVYSEC